MKETTQTPRPTFQKGRLALWMALLTYGLYAISSLGLASLYVAVASDVLLASTFLPILLDTLIQIIQTLLIPAVAWGLICFAYFQKESTSCIRGLILLYLGSLLFCRLADLALTLGFQGFLSVTDDILFAVWYFLLDAALLLILWLTVRSRAQALRKKEQLQAKADLITLREETVKITVTPLDPKGSLFKKENPLLSCTLLLAIIHSAIKVVQRILYDVFYSIEQGALPTLEEIPIMIVYYLGDILSGICFYLLARLLYRLLFRNR